MHCTLVWFDCMAAYASIVENGSTVYVAGVHVCVEIKKLEIVTAWA